MQLMQIVRSPSIIKILSRLRKLHILQVVLPNIDHSPPPCAITGRTVHLCDERRDETIDSTGDNASGAEVHIAGQILLSCVVRADEVRSTGDESCLTHALKETRDDKLFPSFDETAANDSDTFPRISDTYCRREAQAYPMQSS